jgi:hypothetical protein
LIIDPINHILISISSRNTYVYGFHVLIAQQPWNFPPILVHQVDKLLGDLRRIGPKPVALDEHIFGLADGIVGTVAFGNIYGTEQFAHKKHFQHILNEAMEMLASFSAEDFFPNIAGRRSASRAHLQGARRVLRDGHRPAHGPHARQAGEWRRPRRRPHRPVEGAKRWDVPVYKEPCQGDDNGKLSRAN